MHVAILLFESDLYFQRRSHFETFIPMLSHVNEKEKNVKNTKCEILQFFEKPFRDSP